MTPEIITRSFSNDQFFFDKVFFDNQYQIKGDKDRHRVFVDIGAHAGYFTFTALSLGAGKVYCFEPYIDSFAILLKNCYTPNFLHRVTPYQLGVYTSPIFGKFSAPPLIDNLYFDFGGVGLSTKPDEFTYPCPCTTLSTLLKENCFDEHIDVLKINIGYAEREILTGADPILEKNVSSICGEVSCTEEEFLEFKKSMGLRGFIHCVSKPIDQQGRTTFQMSQVNLSENFI